MTGRFRRGAAASQPATIHPSDNAKMTAIRHAFTSFLLGLAMWSGATAQAQTPAPATIPADPSNFSRNSAFEYDPDNGLLISETVEPDNAKLCVKTTYKYDDYGNRTSTTTKNCDGADGTATFAARTSGAEYAAGAASGGDLVSATVPAGMFASKATNALKHSETRMMDARYGVPVAVTAPNGLLTSWQIDAFGRTYKEVRADGTATLTFFCYLGAWISDLSSNFNCTQPSAAEVPDDAVSFISSVQVLAANDKPNGPVSRAYIDRAGRKIRTVTEAFDGSAQTTAKDRLIIQDTVYNEYGHVAFSTQPYFLDSGASTSAGAGAVGITASIYDELGRPTDVYLSDPKGLAGIFTFGAWGSATASHTHIDYKGMSTVTKNDLGQTNTLEKNVDGKVGIVTNALGAQLAHAYDAFGNLLTVKDALQNAVVISYDIRGRKMSMTDPDSGTWLYGYNALGELTSQQSPNQLAMPGKPFTTMEYDPLGRMTKRVEPEYTSTWYYDSYADGTACNKGMGKLCETQTTNGTRRRLVYDNAGRVINTRVDITDGPSFASAVNYDGVTSRPATQTFPTGLSVKYNYTDKGFLSSLTLVQAATVNPLPATAGGAAGPSTTLPAGSVLWQALSYDAWGHAEQQIYGNNVITKTAFNALTGRVDNSTAGISSDTSVANYQYEWDSLNRLKVRTDGTGAAAVTNNYDYDEIGRLHNYKVTSAQINTPDQIRNVTVQYNAVGSPLYKSDVGIYNYTAQDTSRPHAIKEIVVGNTVTSSYAYDANGNMITATGGAYRQIAYTSFNLPDSQTGLTGAPGAPQYTWQYDEAHQRVKEVRTLAGVTRTTWMVHPDNAGSLVFEREQTGDTVSNRHYISVGGASIGVLISDGALPALDSAQTAPAQLASATFSKVEYWHKDHLGSLIATTDHNGATTEHYAYDPFGKRRYTDGNYDANGSIIADWNRTNKGTDRGYTGQEHLDDVGVIHMNGRIYDPALGLFMQADPFIQNPTNLQNLNRYGYCYNNPMTCTDPTGKLFGWDDFFIAVIAIWGAEKANIINTQTARTLTSIAFSAVMPVPQSMGQAAATGFASGAIASGNVKGALQGAFTAGMFFGAGTVISENNWGTAAGVTAHAVVGCVTSEASGGQCGAGALSAGFSKAMSGTDFMQSTIADGDRLTGSVVNAVVGGTASVLGGGKFENGAVTGAFSYLFNDAAHPRQYNDSPVPSGLLDVLHDIYDGAPSWPSLLGIPNPDIGSGNIGKAQLVLSYVELSATAKNDQISSVYIGVRNTPGYTWATSIERQWQIGDTSGLTVKATSGAAFGAYLQGSAAVYFSGSDFGASAAIALGNKRQVSEVKRWGFNPPSYGVGYTFKPKK